MTLDTDLRPWTLIHGPRHWHEFVYVVSDNYADIQINASDNYADIKIHASDNYADTIVSDNRQGIVV